MRQPRSRRCWRFSYSKETSISHVFDVKEPGDYRLVIEDNIRGDFFVSPQRMELTVTFDDRQLWQKEYGWQMKLDENHVFNLRCEPGGHALTFAIKPVTPGRGQDIVYNIRKVRLEGPLDEARWGHPPSYARFFPRDVPADAAGRRTYARELIGAFATKAFRRPATAASVEPLVDIAEKFYTAPGGTFEAAIAQAMVAVLSSPRFLFRVENPAPAAPNATVANIDEHSLASRLSYFLWSTMPDEELLKLAGAGQLRANLAAQVKRMLADPRSANFIEHFPGQWLQSRLVATVPLNQREILKREGVNPPSSGRGGFGGGGGANVSDGCATPENRVRGEQFTNVSVPTLTVYRPAPEKALGVAMIISPGGGYTAVWANKEGEQPAKWLVERGFTAILLKYRVPNLPQPNRYLKGMQDLQRSVSLVRSKAKELGVDPNRIGLIGFSAGCQMMAGVATNFTPEGLSYPQIDDVDKVSSRPDFEGTKPINTWQDA